MALGASANEVVCESKSNNKSVSDSDNMNKSDDAPEGSTGEWSLHSP